MKNATARDYLLQQTMAHLKETALRIATEPEVEVTKEGSPMDHRETHALLEELVNHIIQFKQLSRGPIVYYGDPDQEYLYKTTIDGAVETILSSGYHTPEDFPETVEVAGFRHIIPSTSEATYPLYYSPLQTLLEILDEEHLSEDDAPTEPSQAMKTAEERFIQAVLLEYRSYWCESVSVIKVNVREWLKRKHPYDPAWTPIQSLTTQVCGHCYHLRGANEMRTCTACKKRGCSKCWRSAQKSSQPWPRMGPFPHIFTCSFRHDEKSEQQKVAQEYEHKTIRKGYAYHYEGPVHAE